MPLMALDLGGHAHLSATQRHLSLPAARGRWPGTCWRSMTASAAGTAPAACPAAGYRAKTLRVLFGEDSP